MLRLLRVTPSHKCRNTKWVGYINPLRQRDRLGLGSRRRPKVGSFVAEVCGAESAPANQSGNLIHLLPSRTRVSRHLSAEAVNDPAAEFVNRQMSYGWERFFEDLYFRWIKFASTAPGFKNVQ